MLGLPRLKKGIIMTENQETFTRDEVKALLKQQTELTVAIVREHFAAERAKDDRVARLAVIILGVVVLVLWGSILWG